MIPNEKIDSNQFKFRCHDLTPVLVRKIIESSHPHSDLETFLKIRITSNSSNLSPDSNQFEFDKKLLPIHFAHSVVLIFVFIIFLKS